MTKITIEDESAFVPVTIYANGQSLRLEYVLIDTGSGATVFKTQDLESIGVKISMEDAIVYMVGIGGSEAVVEKQIEALEVGDLRVSPFKIQLGKLNYGFKMDGILGLDFLLKTSAQLNFNTLEITKA
jgi:predicted aspartyl protease